MFEILFPALLTGLLLSLITAPLGAFVVWRKMAYFGDTLSHSALLGVALGIFLQINPYVAIVILTIILAVLMVSHDLHIVMADSKEVLCINQHICCAGTPESLSNDPTFMRLWGNQISQNVGFYTHHHNHHHNMHGDVCGCSANPSECQQ